jgi:hypothetical protein
MAVRDGSFLLDGAVFSVRANDVHSASGRPPDTRRVISQTEKNAITEQGFQF